MTTEVHDLVIIGAGPSALAAAMYAARENIETILIEKATVGGIIASVNRVDNYPGFLNGVSGATLARSFRAQAEKFGARIRRGEVTKVEKVGELVMLTTDAGVIMAKTTLVATGSTYERLWILGEEGFYGNGIHYAAIPDGTLYRGKRLAVVGGGNSAVQEALTLAQLADHVDIVVRSHVKASSALQRELDVYLKNGNIGLYAGYIPDRIIANGHQITGLAICRSSHQNVQELTVDGVFIFAGVMPNTAFLVGSDVELDSAGHVITDHQLMTNVPGIFASGDARSDTAKQLATAIGDGTTAALAIREYLVKKQSGIA